VSLVSRRPGAVGAPGTLASRAIPSSDFSTIRETCICEQPTCSAISDWIRPCCEAQAQPDGFRDGAWVLVAVAPLLLEPGQPAAFGGLQSLFDPLGRAPEVAGELGHRRLLPGAGAVRVTRRVERDEALPEPTWLAHVPRGVAEMAAQLAEDRGPFALDPSYRPEELASLDDARILLEHDLAAPRTPE
jgi:hypothetical protein